MKSVFCGVSTLFAVLFISKLAFAAQLTSDFRDFESPFLVTYPIGLPPLGGVSTLGPVTITNSPTNSAACCAAYFIGTPSDPADVGSWGGTGRLLPITLNMSAPVKAFGITFETSFNDLGSILAVYDGPNGTGQLIGQVQSIVVPPPWSEANQPIDFVGVIDEYQRIRSARLFAQGSDRVLIAAMALSIPEPTVLSTLVTAAMLTLLSVDSRKR